MDATFAMSKTISFIATISTSQKITNPTTTLTTSDMITLCSCKRTSFRNRKQNVLTITCCSTKPNIDSENTTDENLTVEKSSNSKSLSRLKPAFSASISSPFSRGLVFDLGDLSSWDGAEIGSPVVRRFKSDDEERWYMWYHGRSFKNDIGDTCPDLIGLTVSSNGVHWERGSGPTQSSTDVGMVMSCSKDWWCFDTQSIRPSEMVIMSSEKVRANSAVYWLYYTGFNSENVEVLDGNLGFKLENPERDSILNDEKEGKGKVWKSMPGLAISQDGRHWARIEGEHHSGALLDVGSEKEWDSTYIASPQVVYHKYGDLRMYYHSFDPQNGHFATGMARSRDGIKWVKLGKILGGRDSNNAAFDKLGAMNACVARNRKDGNYVMAYEGVAENGKKSIGLAVSEDGLKEWRRHGDEAILKASEDKGWDNGGVGSPCLVQMDGDVDEWRLYYRGVGNDGKTGIGMAVSQGSDLTSLRRWSGFHL